MRVSVIIPAFNAARTLPETLESLLAQSVADWEAIVVNDGSTDATSQIAQSFAEQDSRIAVISQQNGGESAARNAGLAVARSEWLLFLDADDWIAPAYLERLTGELEADSQLDAVHCGWSRVAANGLQIVSTYRTPIGDLFPVLARRAAFPVHACIVRKALIEAAGKFDTTLKTCPDWDLWQRIARAGARFGGVPETLAFYRMSPQSASLNAQQLLQDGMTVLRRGHSHDPRVANPLAEYANGLVGSTVESQEFYILSWNAGLLIGTGSDARPLLRIVGDDHYSELDPDSIAQCLFEAAPLPRCLPLEGWEDLWPSIRERAEEFLLALEAQSATPGLALGAFLALKRRVLKASPSWAPLVDEHERISASHQECSSRAAALETEKTTLQGLLNESRQSIVAHERQLQALSREREAAWLKSRDVEAEAATQTRELERQKQLMDVEMDDLRRSVQALEGELAFSTDELNKWRHSAEERALIVEQIQEQTWVRLGHRLRMAKRRPIEPATQSVRPLPEMRGDQSLPGSGGSAEEKWYLQIQPGNHAHIIYPREDRRRIRIGIDKGKRGPGWGIQLNRAGLKVVVGESYALVFRARADRARTIGVGFAMTSAPWSNLGLYETLHLMPEWKDFRLEFVARADDESGRIHFDLGGKGVGVDLSSVTLEEMTRMDEQGASALIQIPEDQRRSG